MTEDEKQELEEKRKKIIKSWKWRITKANLTPTSFSKSIGIDQSHLSQILNGKHRPHNAYFEQVENALKEMGV